MLFKFALKGENDLSGIFFIRTGPGIDISKHPLIKEADILHFHYFLEGYLSLKSLNKLFKLNKKIVWTAHDFWPFTGGCYYNDGCTNYMNKCGQCPQLQSKNEFDLSRKIFNKKSEIYRDVNLHLIACSSWLKNCIKKSTLLGDKKIDTIPDILNDNIFKNIDRNTARYILNLKQNKDYILYGGTAPQSTKIKGWSYLKKSLMHLHESDHDFFKDLELLIFGHPNNDAVTELPLKVNFLNYIHDEPTLALIYNAANLFVSPSLQEAFGQTINESIFCHTPAVAFADTGPIDIIMHKDNGYLAQYKDVVDLAEGIRWTLNNLDKVGVAFQSLYPENIIKKYMKIYKN